MRDYTTDCQPDWKAIPSLEEISILSPEQALDWLKQLLTNGQIANIGRVEAERQIQEAIQEQSGDRYKASCYMIASEIKPISRRLL